MTEPITINALLRQGDITGFDDAEIIKLEDEEKERRLHELIGDNDGRLCNKSGS